MHYCDILNMYTRPKKKKTDQMCSLGKGEIMFKVKWKLQIGSLFQIW